MATTGDNQRAAAAALLEEPDPMPKKDDRRSHDRFDVEWAVDCVADDTFLYASIANISAMGVFVKTTDPLAIGMRLVLSFAAPGQRAVQARGPGRMDQRGAARRGQPEPGDGRAVREPAPRRARAPGRGD